MKSGAVHFLQSALEILPFLYYIFEDGDGKLCAREVTAAFVWKARLMLVVESYREERWT